MSLKDKIEQDLRQALKEKNKAIISVLRLIRSALINRQIELRSKKQELTDEEIVKVLQKEAKKRKESIEMFTRGGREGLANKEREELLILEKYLPKQLSEDEIRGFVQTVIKEIGEVSEKSFGLVMKEVMSKVKGRAEGSVVSRLVREVLGEKK